MAMSRAVLMERIWADYQDDLQRASLVKEDTTGNLKEPIDDTLTALGIAYNDLEAGAVPDGSEAKAILLARFYVLQKVWRWAKGQIDIQVDAPTVRLSRSQFFDHVTAELADAKAAASPFIPTANESTWGVGTISLDFLEPSCWGEYA